MESRSAKGSMTARQYHDLTGYDRHRMSPHFLDWGNQPSLFKSYPGLDPIPLPRHLTLSEDRLSSVLNTSTPGPDSRPPDANRLSQVLALACGITARARHGGGDFYFRSAASAGALYPFELYLASQGVRGIPDGLYHVAILPHALVPLRRGRIMESVTLATEPVSRYAPHLTFFLSAIFFRSAWKYRDRAYRYHLLDTGHLAENILLALKAASIPHELSYDFDDRMVNQLLGLNETKEVCLAVCHVPGREPLEKAPDPVKIPELDPSIGEASRVAGEEIDYTPIGKIHKAGTPKKSLPEPVSPMVWNLGLTAERHEPIHTPGHWPESLSLADAFHQRRSRRNFVPREMPIDCLMSLLDALCTAEPRDQTQSILGTGLLVGRAEGMAAGFYLLDAANKHAALVRAGSFIEPMARICLNQEWLKHAAVHFLFLTNLDRLDRLCGARGYRYAMLAAGRLGQRVYLAATAMAMGCCGIGAFYDGEAAELLGLTQGSKLLYLVAAGPVKSLEADRS